MVVEKLLDLNEDSRIVIVSTKILREELKKRSKNDNLWLTPEGLDYRLRFKTNEVLDYPEIFILGMDIFQNHYRGSKLEFALIRMNLYNPLIKIVPVKIINEDLLFYELFSNKLLNYTYPPPVSKDKFFFFISKTYRDMIPWYHILKRNYDNILVITSSIPFNLLKRMLSVAGKKAYPLIATKDLAFKLASLDDKLILLPNIDNSKPQEEAINYADMCLLLTYERRIKKRSIIAHILTESYNCTTEDIHKVLDKLISFGILHEFPSKTLVTTFLGKTIVRNFLSLTTSMKVIKNNNSLRTKEELYNLIHTLPEFSHEKILKDKLNKSKNLPNLIKNTLMLSIIKKEEWLINGISGILLALKNTKSVKLYQELFNKLQEKKGLLINMIEEGL